MDINGGCHLMQKTNLQLKTFMTKIYIDPDQNLVIVKNSANYRFTDKSLNWKAKHYAMFHTISKFFSKEQLALNCKDENIL
jgi:hypothetical protein